jgi:hypothetical protein
MMTVSRRGGQARHDVGGHKEAPMALFALAVVLILLGLAGMLVLTSWLEHWLPPPDRIAAHTRSSGPF